MASTVTKYRLRVRSETGDFRTLISHESPENFTPIVFNEYGTLVQADSLTGKYAIGRGAYSEVSRECFDCSAK
jgi:hypothetical protein